MEFHFSLRMSCFVNFLSAELSVTGGDPARVSLSISDADYVYEGAVDTDTARRFCDTIGSEIQTRDRDKSWSAGGLDGTDYRGSYESSSGSAIEFSFWSPGSGTSPHRLACAALELVPVDHANLAFELQLEELREDLGIGVPLRWVWDDPPRLRILGTAPPRERPEIEKALGQLPTTGNVVVDARVFHGHMLHSWWSPLLERDPPPVWWILHKFQEDMLREHGVLEERIVTMTRP